MLLIRETDRGIVVGKRRVGAMILDDYFDGDPKQAFKRGRGREKSFELLASVVEDTTGSSRACTGGTGCRRLSYHPAAI